MQFQHGIAKKKTQTQRKKTRNGKNWIAKKTKSFNPAATQGFEPRRDRFGSTVWCAITLYRH